MNSCSPYWFESSCPQKPARAGRFAAAPRPSRQSYESAKQPPGQRSSGASTAFIVSMKAWRMPRVFGIFESGPTHTPS